MNSRSLTSAVLTGALLAPLAMLATGCSAGAFIGGMAESYRRNSTRTVEAEYRGLEGKNFAVLVTAPAVVQAEFPQLVDRVTTEITARLAENNQANASGFVPPDRVINWMYNRPNWVARPLGDIAKELGVQRIIYVDITEYRLNDTGNSYLWDGIAAATISVVEADGVLKDDFAFNKAISVKFPDQGGFTQNDIPRAGVNTELTRRLTERSAWLFYTHEEPYYPKY
jgi:hypothetical protein